MSPTIFRLLCRYNNLYDMPGSVATGQERFRHNVRPSVNSIDYSVFKQNDKPINLPMRPRYSCRVASVTVNDDKIVASALLS